jgi:soluble lytic murein transglycosylase-like protein
MALRTRYWGLIQEVAAKYTFDPLLIEALVVQESSGNTDAFRFEPDFWNRYLKGKPEWAGKNPRRVSSSYGLMQVMFPVALERGFPVVLAPESLFIPELGLEWGCKHLTYLRTWAKALPVDEATQTLAMIAAYNGGKGGNDPTKNTPLRTAKYAREVLAKAAILTAEHASGV